RIRLLPGSPLFPYTTLFRSDVRRRAAQRGGEARSVDSPNSAGVVIDAIRCCKLALDRGLGGTIVAPASYFMKSPPTQIHDDRARLRVEDFIAGRDNETLVGKAS